MKNICNRRIIYHGSEFVIEHPVYGAGKAHNDYGLGFYCTEERDLAMEWAVGERHDGHANRYELDMTGLKVLNLVKKPFTPLHWLSILVRNRVFDMDGDVIRSASRYLQENFPVDLAGVDVVIGWRADDNYFSFARGFLNGTLSYQQLCRAIKLGGLGLQTVLVSPTAFTRLRFLGEETARRSDWLVTRQRREFTAREGFADMMQEGLQPSQLYLVNIVQQGMKGDDARLPTVLS